jgi:hypothetical protein
VKYWIQDKDETPQQFPLSKLTLLIKQQLTQIGLSTYEFWISRANGYGPRIYELDELLDEQDRILVKLELLEELSIGIEEWFYNIDIEVVADNLHIQFGLHDSTALYIDAPQFFSEPIINNFKLVREI